MIRIIRHGVKPIKTVVETTTADHEDVHLQSAHDALRQRIRKLKSGGKDSSALEARLKKIADPIGKKED